MNKRLLIFAAVSFSSAILIGCGEEGLKKDFSGNNSSVANNAVLRAKCPRGFDPDLKDNPRLSEVLNARYKGQNTPAVRTYLTRYEVPAGAAPVVEIPNENLITQVKAEDYAAGQSQISVAKNCEDLTATFRGQGVELTGLTITAINMHEITLKKMTDNGELTVTVKQDGRTKIVRSTERKQGKLDKKAQKALTRQDFADGNTVTNVTFELKGATSQKIELQQVTGNLLNTDTVNPDASARSYLANRAEDQQAAAILNAAPAADLSAQSVDAGGAPVVASAPAALEPIPELQLLQLQGKLTVAAPVVEGSADQSGAAPVSPAVEPGVTIQAPVNGTATGAAATSNGDVRATPAVLNGNAASPAAAAAATPGASTLVTGQTI